MPATKDAIAEALGDVGRAVSDEDAAAFNAIDLNILADNEARRSVHDAIAARFGPDRAAGPLANRVWRCLCDGAVG